MALTISLDFFEGPFDLLCHLLDENQVDIYDIPIAEITGQYLEYLDNMAELDLDIASEFLVLAATLISIKTKMLLPAKEKDDGDNLIEDEEDDPRSELVQQILEYKKYKELAVSLEELMATREKEFSRPNNESEFVALLHPEAVYKGFSVEKLSKAMEAVLEKMEQRKVIHEIRRNTITIENRMEYIRDRLEKEPDGLVFMSLCDEETDKYCLIILFLALLEMIRGKMICVMQKEICGDIVIFPFAKE